MSDEGGVGRDRDELRDAAISAEGDEGGAACDEIVQLLASDGIDARVERDDGDEGADGRPGSVDRVDLEDEVRRLTRIDRLQG